jgi:hypothetical protein
MKLQIELWRLFASLSCFAVSFALGRMAVDLARLNAWSGFLSVLCAIFCLAFFTAAVGVLFRRGWRVALATLEAIGAFIP